MLGYRFMCLVLDLCVPLAFLRELKCSAFCIFAKQNPHTGRIAIAFAKHFKLCENNFQLLFAIVKIAHLFQVSFYKTFENICHKFKATGASCPIRILFPNLKQYLHY